jgi:alpha-methylacyl-CoA racemase
MVDGAATLMAMFFTMSAVGAFKTERGTNLLDGGAHFYDTYETSDGKHICIGSIEPQFYALLLEKAGLDREQFKPQMDAGQWPALKAQLTEVFKTRTRDEWCAAMEGTDVCFAPVLSILEAPDHPHNRARNTFIEVDGVVQPAPAPRFSRTVPTVSHASPRPGVDSTAVLSDCGFTADEIAELRDKGVIPAE